MNVGSEKAQIEIEEDTNLNNTNKWTTEMKVNIQKIEECERNRGCEFMKRMKEAWNDKHESSTMGAQTLRDNPARLRKDNLLLHLRKVRDSNDVEPDAIHIKATEPVRSQENIEENENNEEENINEEADKETRTMRLRFEEMLHTLKASAKENIERRECLMKLKKGAAKAGIGRSNKTLEKHLDNINNIYTVIDAVYTMGQTIEERKELKGNGKRKSKKYRRDLIGGYKNLKSILKNRERFWIGHKMTFIGGKLKENQLKRKRGFFKSGQIIN